MCAKYDENVLQDMLPLYYNRLFPYKPYYRWLSYGNVNKNYFPHREFSFTIQDDVYLRYQSFANCDELEKEFQKHRPHKIDIGAVFTFRPKDHRTAVSFQPIEKELVFDIDMTDYDDVRYCCSGADMCKKCWPLIVIAIKILDAALRKDFGYDHLLWVYSGRRGIHCWVCDEGARKLNAAARSAVADYLSVVIGGESITKKVNLTVIEFPFFTRCLKIIKDHFEELHVENQDFLANAERWNKVLALITDRQLRTTLASDMERLKDSAQRWKHIENELSKPISSSKSGDRKQIYPVEEIILQLCYPRLDINVSKGLNHLLKSPFCIHPKTGRVCVPIDVNNLETFNPFSVPTISQLVDEINRHDAEMRLSIEDANDDDTNPKKKVKDYKKTNLCHSVEVFKEFVKKLETTWAGKRLAQSDLKGDF